MVRSHPHREARRFVLLAVAFELSLGLLALILGYLTGPPPADLLRQPGGLGAVAAVLCGAGWAIPLFGAIVAVERQQWRFLHDLQYIVRQHILPLFRDLHPLELLFISLAAGIGEELLFRGYVQTGLTHWSNSAWGSWGAVLVAALLFGICHWLCWTYALLATVMGLALGALLLVTHNLLAPITAHAVYDFLALLYLLRSTDHGRESAPRDLPSPPPESFATASAPDASGPPDRPASDGPEEDEQQGAGS